MKMDNKIAAEILDEISERTGWNEASQLALALEYIDNQCSWRDFLERRAGEEEDLSVEGDAEPLVPLS
jgi:hypothetical protein